MRRLIVCSFFICLIFGTSFRDGVGQVKTGTTGFRFLRLGINAREVSMGGAGVASVRGVNAIHLNPALLHTEENIGMTFSHISWIADVNYESGAVAYNVEGIGTFAFNFNYLGLGDLNETDPLNLVDRPGGDLPGNFTDSRTFTFSDMAFGLSFARQITDKFAAGGRVSLIREHMTGTNAMTKNSPAFDIGISYDTGWEGLEFGASTQNFGPDVTYFTRSFKLPLISRIGFSLNMLQAGGLFAQDGNQHRLTLLADALQPNDFEEQANLGAEYGFKELFFVRGGYRINADQESWSAGAGYCQSLQASQFNVDFAYGDFGDFLDSVYRVSVGFSY